MNILGLTFVFLLGFLVFVLPRSLVYLPILISVCFVTMEQAVVIAGLNFSSIRILVFFSWVRMFIRQEAACIKFNEIDKALILWLLCGFTIYFLREQTVEALVNRLGFIYNGFGIYFMFRIFVKDQLDVERAIKTLALLSLPLAIALTVEKLTGQNLFSIFGGVSEYSWVRDGKIRAQGPFAHAILAGTFGAAMTPLSLGLIYKQGRDKIYGQIGFVAATLTVWCATSSVSLFSYVCGLVAMVMWRFRDKLRMIIISILLMLIMLHLIMKAPVWYLLSRAGEVMGGTGWHRAYLIDQAIAYFDEWWLLGTAYTAHWFPYALPTYPNQTDITNQFILQGVDGGLLTMIVFIAVLFKSFKAVGIATRDQNDQLPNSKMLNWSLGACLMVMVVSFMGVTYFDQMIVVWYLLLAMIAQISINSLATDSIEAQ